MVSARRARTPVGEQAPRWRTITPQRQVLVVAHNVTAVSRLLDVLPLFEGDFRVQLTFTWNGHDPFSDGLDDMFHELGISPLPWEQTVDLPFDLVITAAHGGLDEIHAPIVSVPHGIRYTKYLPQKTKNKKQKTKARSRKVFGLSEQWLFDDGEPLVSALVLSHEQQRERLVDEHPELSEIAIVAGDPCYDRLRESLAWRARYRAALGVSREQSLVALSSTWWSASTLARGPELLTRLLAELPLDEYRVAAILHPNIWYGHGRHQLRRWLAPAERSGLVVVPPESGWRAVLAAADFVVGDHGSVTTYGAALGRPTLLAAFPETEVAPDSVVDHLGRTAPKLHPHQPIPEQLKRVAVEHADSDEIRESITSRPDDAAHRLRRLFYSMLELAEPEREPPVPPDGLTGLPDDRENGLATAMFVHGAMTTTDDGRSRVELTRYPAEMTTARNCPPTSHLVAFAHHSGRQLRRSADVLVLADGDEWGEGAKTWVSETFDAQRGLALATVLHHDRCTVYTRDGRRVELTAGSPQRMDLVRCASAVYLWFSAGHDITQLPTTLMLGTDPVHVTVESF